MANWVICTFTQCGYNNNGWCMSEVIDINANLQCAVPLKRDGTLKTLDKTNKSIKIESGVVVND